MGRKIRFSAVHMITPWLAQDFSDGLLHPSRRIVRSSCRLRHFPRGLACHARPQLVSLFIRPRRSVLGSLCRAGVGGIMLTVERDRARLESGSERGTRLMQPTRVLPAVAVLSLINVEYGGWALLG